MLKIEDGMKLGAVAEILCKGSGDARKLIEDEVEKSISEDLYKDLQQLTVTFLHETSDEITFGDIELFDCLFTVAEKARLLEVIMQSQRFEADLFEILTGQKMYFIRLIVNNREAFKLFLIYQLSAKDRKRAREFLKSEGNSSLFVKYLDKDILSSMRGTKIIDFEKMSTYDSTHTTKGTYPEGSKIVYEDGVEIVVVPGSKKSVEFDGTPPHDAEKLFGHGFRFNYIQSVVQREVLGSDDNVLVCAPTGSGKTIIGALSILREIEKNENIKVAYLVPMKALVTEVCKTLADLFSKYGLKVIEQTSDIHLPYSRIEEANVIVSTPEKLDILTRNTHFDFSLLIIDEIHLLNDPRGAVIEALVARMLTGGVCRIIGLSASLPNYADIGAFIRCKDANVFYFGPEFRKTAIDYELINVGSREREMPMVVEKILENIESGGPIIVFVHSRDETLAVGREIKGYMERARFSVVDVEVINNPEIKELLRYGVGVHHAGLDKKTRMTIEELYRNERISVLISTATLAWGVNLPGKTVIIKGVDVYKPELSGWMSLGQTDIIQMFGRAGRFKEDKCKGILISSRETEFLVQRSIDSRLLTSVCDCLNAEIVRGISRFEEAVDWLKHTFYYTRLIRINKKPGKIINEIIYSALKHLEKAGLILLDSRIFPTFMGRISARYYIHYRDAQRLFSKLGPLMLESSLFSIVEDSREFKNLTMDKKEMESLREILPIPTESVFGIFLQNYVANRVGMQTEAVARNAPRMFGALFEMAVRKNLGLSKTILGWSKAVVHRIFPYQTPLRHFVDDMKVMRELETKEIPFGMLEALGREGLNEIGIDGDCVVSHLKYVPRFSIIPSIYISKLGLHIISLDIEKTFSDDRLTHNSYYLLITDEKDERLLLCDSVTFRKESTYSNLYYAILCPRSPFVNICLLSSYYLCPTEPTVLDLRNIKDTEISIFSGIWRDWILGLLPSAYAGNSITLSLFYDTINTDAVVVSNEAERRMMSPLGYMIYTYEEFISERATSHSVTITNMHHITFNHLVEACIVHCISNGIKMSLVGLPFTEGDLGIVGKVNEFVSKEDIKAYGSSGLTYYSQLADYKIELLSNIDGLDTSGNACLIICPVMKTIMYFMRFFKDAKIATEYSAIKNGFYFVTKNVVDSWIQRRWRPEVCHVHIMGTTYYDYEGSSFVDYSLADVKKYSLLGSSTFLYLRESKMLFYFRNNDIPLYYNSSNRKELLVYSYWLGHPSPTCARLPPFIDGGITKWGTVMCKYSVSISTMELFMERVRDKMGLKNILSLACSAEELQSDINSDVLGFLAKLNVDLSRGKTHALTCYFLNRGNNDEMDEVALETYANTTLPILHRIYLCLVEIALTNSYLKTAFNAIFGLQNIMKVFVKFEEKFYNAELLDGSISINIFAIPEMAIRQRITFFLLTDSGNLEILYAEKAAKYSVSWNHKICYLLCDCHAGFETKEQDLKD